LKTVDGQLSGGSNPSLCAKSGAGTKCTRTAFVMWLLRGIRGTNKDFSKLALAWQVLPYEMSEHIRFVRTVTELAVVLTASEKRRERSEALTLCVKIPLSAYNTKSRKF